MMVGDPVWHVVWMGAWLLMNLIVIVAVVWTLTRHLPHLHRRHETAEDILKRRYASGELDRQQYEDMLKDIRK